MHYKIFKTVKSGKTKYYIQYQNDDGAWEFIEEISKGIVTYDCQTKMFDSIKKAKEYMAKFIKNKKLADTPDIVVYEAGEKDFE